MRPSRFQIVTPLLAVLCLVAIAHGAVTLPGEAAVTKDMATGQKLVQQFHLTELMGPLAPIALSPYFGLMLLSGLAILSSRGVIPGNGFLVGNTALNNEAVFAVFLVLTILTSLPKFTKLSKAFAQIVDQLEAYSSIVALGVIYYFAHHAAPAPATAAVQAGLFSLTGDAILLLMVALNIIVINTVKFFFEMLILISPIPAVDALFEGANKTVAAGLMLIYAFSPWLATVLNVLIFLVCLAIFGFVWRRVRFYRVLLFGLFFKASSPRIMMPPHAALAVPGHDAALPVFVRRKQPGLRTLQHGYLLHGAGGWTFVTQRGLGRSVAVSCGPKLTLARGLLSHTATSPNGLRLAFSRRYDRLLPAWSPWLAPEGDSAPVLPLRNVFSRAQRAGLRAGL